MAVTENAPRGRDMDCNVVQSPRACSSLFAVPVSSPANSRIKQTKKRHEMQESR